jgi:hypothetical protein
VDGIIDLAFDEVPDAPDMSSLPSGGGPDRRRLAVASPKTSRPTSAAEC